MILSSVERQKWNDGMKAIVLGLLGVIIGMGAYIATNDVISTLVCLSGFFTGVALQVWNGRTKP